ncbi:ABC transporter permease [Desertimonas flava]|uniref:ABC transporter permease n=1 Tax=Desertimonas flava TaxID=2064846 RepID=UPI000E353B25|nr:ABC transporter permease [Desertimonas flava]
MISYIIRRLLLLIPTVFFALSFLFLLYFVLPGDPATLLAGGANRNVNPQTLADARHRYGLDQPLWEQFWNFWRRTIRWDLGTSFVNNRSVNDMLGEKAPRSIRLAIWATLIDIVVGISVGLISAVKRYSVLDRITTFLTALASAIPVFVLGFVLQYFFAVYPEKHDWPQWARLRTSRLGPDSWFAFIIPTGDQWRYLILPAIVLAAVTAATTARMTRGSMLEVLNMDFMRTARSKGLAERTIIRRHGLRNALIPVVTLIGINFGTAIGAAILTETVFSWPGLGSQIADSVGRRDLPVILGFTLVVVIVFGLINLLVDLSYAWIDPRIRLGESA